MTYCRGQCYKVWHIPFMSDHVCRTGVLCNSVVKAKKQAFFKYVPLEKVMAMENDLYQEYHHKT